MSKQKFEVHTSARTVSYFLIRYTIIFSVFRKGPILIFLFRASYQESINIHIRHSHFCPLFGCLQPHSVVYSFSRPHFSCEKPRASSLEVTLCQRQTQLADRCLHFLQLLVITSLRHSHKRTIGNREEVFSHLGEFAPVEVPFGSSSRNYLPNDLFLATILLTISATQIRDYFSNSGFHCISLNMAKTMPSNDDNQSSCWYLIVMYYIIDSRK